jgi:ABC-type spermidine/putrescine transport system permease subunit II
VKPAGFNQTNSAQTIFYLLCGLIFLYLIFPILIVIPISFSSSSYLEFPPRGFSLRWFINFFTRRDWLSATLLSVKVALMVTIFSTLLGIPASFALARSKFFGKDWVYAFILSPMIVPLIITAIAIYFLYAKLKLIGSSFGLVLGHSTLAIPKVVIILIATLQTFDETLEKASMSLGANPLRTFFKVTLPVIRPGVISAAVFAFITSFDELIITMFICGAKSVTLPKRMWDGIRLEIDPTIAAVSSFIIFVSILILFLAEFFRRRGERMVSQP